MRLTKEFSCKMQKCTVSFLCFPQLILMQNLKIIIKKIVNIIEQLKKYCFQYKMDNKVQVLVGNFHLETSHCFSQNTTHIWAAPQGTYTIVIPLKAEIKKIFKSLLFMQQNNSDTNTGLSFLFFAFFSFKKKNQKLKV